MRTNKWFGDTWRKKPWKNQVIKFWKGIVPPWQPPSAWGWRAAAA
jgi:hypothetical protein